MDWQYQFFWEKAKKFIERTYTLNDDDELFLLWTLLALELLCKATLAYVNPILVAESINENAALYLSSSPLSEQAPKTATALIAFTRLKRVYPSEITDTTISFVDSIFTQRNIELHSGISGFQTYPFSQWKAEYYKLCKLLLEKQDKTLNEYFDDYHSKLAIRLISQKNVETEEQVYKQLEQATLYFSKLNAEAKKLARRQARNSFARVGYSYRRNTKSILCPVCNSRSLLQGEISKKSAPRIEEEEIVIDITFIPSKFECVVCKLKLSGPERLVAAGIGEPQTYTESISSYYEGHEDDDEDDVSGLKGTESFLINIGTGKPIVEYPIKG